MAFDADTHQVILFGGEAALATKFDDTWAWDGERWQRLHPGASPPARSDAAMAWDPVIHRLVLFGGFTEVASLDLV